ncbi:MaoC/PaaZ C-terminal domain-containing protein [Streptomyces sp. NPDC057199]|uniref:MaoC/PaaZ C-terminal domain-containing protein n=1 Tax=Streptomyces sp. NPDC057199 TaxID=3346047 RepID=UPI003626C6A9
MTTTPVEVGTPLPRWGVAAVDPARMKVLALLLRDPNPIHFDVAAARRSGMPGLVNQGPSNMAMLVNAVQRAFPSGRLTGLRMRLTGRVLAGQAVEVVGEVVEVGTSPAGMTVVCRVRLVAEGSTVLQGEADVLLLPDEGGVDDTEH